eukprot:CAMPEP_0194206178 /NCGR_PEP_ID=MMETSP0156-20130528/5272_1 /TAXON_ID=33649 /ORGANISM="Thalassionema nitzschioides, Strain L26-B" /LENGTH=367 /DNA_ID=CAMNT_0038932625 /DNA_START=56 /DNA_END=1156 /DNA_ORIENTATION=-
MSLFYMNVFRILFASIVIVDLTLAKYRRVLSSVDQCTELGPETPYNTTVSLNFYGNPDSLSDDDMDLISETLGGAIDASSSCLDVLEVVKIDSMIDRRKLTSREVYDMSIRGLDDEEIDFDFTLVFLVSYQCYFCPDDGLFENDGSRRKIMEDMKHGRPRRSVVTEKFNEILRNSNLSPKVEMLNRISEQKQMDECGIETHDLTTEICVTFMGDYTYLREDQTEMDTIEQAVMKAYNTMNQVNPYTCDKLFRKIHKVEYHEVSSIDRDSFILTFAIAYECRGCKNTGAKLFDERVSMFDAGRQDLHVDFQKIGPMELECSCDIQAKFERAPTQDEFSRALKRTIEIRTAQGEIEYVTYDATNGINSE